MAIDLEKCSRADPIRSQLGRINKVAGAADASLRITWPSAFAAATAKNATPQISGKSGFQVRGELFRRARFPATQ